VRWEIESKTKNGLRVIGLIPNINPCLIEGRNGIGKTVAIQLLQLASGTIPDALATQPQLWTSLKDRLGPTRLIGTELQGAERVEFTFTPERWPDWATSEIDLLGRARVDGRDVDAEHFARFVHVERIAGNEDLANTIERHRDVLETQLAEVARGIRDRQAALNTVAGTVLEDLRHNDPKTIAEEMAASEDAERKERSAREEATAAAERLEALLRVEELLRKRNSVDTDAEKLLALRDAALARTRDLEQQLSAAQDTADDLATRLESEGGVAQQLAQAGKTRRHRRSRLDNLSRSVADEATALAVAPGSDEVAEAIADCDRLLEDALDKQRALDTAGQVKVVLDEVIPIVGAVIPDVPDELLADGFVPALTVSSAYAGMSQRRDTLGSQPTPSQIREIAADIASLTKRRDRLVELASSLSTLARAEELLGLAEAEYAELEAKEAEKTQLAKDSRSADEAVGRIQGELKLAHEELASLGQRLQAQGTISRDDADRDIREITAHLEIDEAEVPDLQVAYREQARETERRLLRAELALTDARRRLSSRRAELSRAVSRLTDDSTFSWLTTGLRIVSDDGQADLAAYARIRAAVLAAVDTIAEAERTIAILQGLCREFLRPHRSETSELDSDHGLAKPFAAMLSRRMLRALNSASVRDRVFDGGEAVDLDPVNRNITLRWDSGAVDVRAMASFSTGQQAFAFTQARISDLQPSSKPNRLLVLDEFGAFVSADRMPDLAAFLTTEAVTRVADHVLVILPLQVNYETEIENTLGDLRTAYEERLEQIRAMNYCAVELR
jgi:hypothetical protein